MDAMMGLQYPAPARRIFKYHDGKSPRKADPIRVWRRLHEALGDDDLYETIDRADPYLRDPTSGDAILGQDGLPAIKHPGQYGPAVRKLADAARAAFGVPDAEEADDDGPGWTDEDAEVNLYAYLSWQSKARGFLGTGPGGSPATDSRPASDDSPISSGTASG